MQAIPTSLTGEVVTIAITSVSISTTRTTLAGVSGFNGDHAKTFTFGLVADELLKLVEGPSVEVCALFLSELSPVADTLQILNCNRRVSCLFSKDNDPLADNMVHILHKPRFSSRQPFQRPTNTPGRTLCLSLLEAGAGFGVSFPNMLNMTTTKEPGAIPIGGDCKNIDAPVNTHNCVVGTDNRLDFALERNRNENLVFPDEQACIAKPPAGEIFRKLGFPPKRNALDPPVNRGDGDAVTLEGNITSAFSALKNNGMELELDRVLGGFFGCAECGIFAGNVPNGAGCNLRRKSELTPDLRIGQSVQAHGIRQLSVFKRYTANIVTRNRPHFSGATGNAKVKPDLNFGCASNFRHNLNIINLSEISKQKGDCASPVS